MKQTHAFFIASLMSLLPACLATDRPPPPENESAGTTLLNAAVWMATPSPAERTQEAVRQRAAFDQGCEPKEIDVISIGGGGYVANGCSGSSRYVCSMPARGSETEPVCVSSK